MATTITIRYAMCGVLGDDTGGQEVMDRHFDEQLFGGQHTKFRN